MRLKVLPDCFGTHDPGDKLCVGDVHRNNPACRVMVECRVLQARCSRDGRNPEDVIASTHQASLLTELAEAEGKLPAWRRRRRVRVTDGISPEGEAILSWFKQRLALETGRQWTPPSSAPLVGELYTRVLEQYVSVYVRGATKDVPVARVLFKAHGKIDVELPTTTKIATAAAKAAEARVEFQLCAHGATFYTAARGCNRARAAASARVVASLVRRGVIVFPEVV